MALVTEPVKGNAPDFDQVLQVMQVQEPLFFGSMRYMEANNVVLLAQPVVFALDHALRLGPLKRPICPCDLFLAEVREVLQQYMYRIFLVDHVVLSIIQLFFFFFNDPLLFLN
jgi:hypothetical protein